MQLLSYKPLSNSILYRDLDVESLILKGELNIIFGDKFCVGWKDDSYWNPCPYEEKGVRQCRFCRSKDISKVYTVHNFEGYEYLEKEVSEAEATIYLASFGSLLKVGISFSRRICDRIREQGADYYIELMKMKREDAYQMESFIKETFSIRERITEKQKFSMLGKKHLAKRALESLVSSIKETEPFSSYISSTQIKEVDHINLYSNKESKHIVGKVLGNKGSLLFIKNDDISVVLMKEKEGRVFSFGNEKKYEVNYISLADL